jgi:hypothetical protein
VIVSSSQADYPSLARAQRMSALLRTAALSPGDAARELEIDELTIRGYCTGQPAPRHVTLAIERLVHLRSIKVYHIVRAEHAVDVLHNGFHDGVGSGVRVSNRLLIHLSHMNPNDMACFQIKVSRERLLRYECTDKGHGYREFLVPAFELNEFPRRRLPDKEWLSMPWGR